MRRGSVPVDSEKAPTRRYRLGIRALYTRAPPVEIVNCHHKVTFPGI